MNVQKNETTFPFPVLFLLGARASAGGQVLGALIAKQRIPFIEEIDGFLAQQPPQSSPILLTDELFAPEKTRLEADVTVYKPRLDVIAVASVFSTGLFGPVTVTRGGVQGAVTLTYGWRPRAEKPRGSDDQSLGWAGNAKEFKPDVADPFKLPTGFDDLYFSGRRFDTDIGGALVTGNSVHFKPTAPDLPNLVTIPAGPKLNFTRDCWAMTPPVMVSQGVDTVVLLAGGSRQVLLTWRFVFIWEDRLALATLEVS